MDIILISKNPKPSLSSFTESTKNKHRPLKMLSLGTSLLLDESDELNVCVDRRFQPLHE